VRPHLPRRCTREIDVIRVAVAGVLQLHSQSWLCWFPLTPEGNIEVQRRIAGLRAIYLRKGADHRSRRVQVGVRKCIPSIEPAGEQVAVEGERVLIVSRYSLRKLLPNDSGRCLPYNEVSTKAGALSARFSRESSPMSGGGHRRARRQIPGHRSLLLPTFPERLTWPLDEVPARRPPLRPSSASCARTMLMMRRCPRGRPSPTGWLPPRHSSPHSPASARGTFRAVLLSMAWPAVDLHDTF